jgi:hypothetical protein
VTAGLRPRNVAQPYEKGKIMDKKTYEKGLEVRKAVLGEAYVNNALKNVDDFNRPFQEMLTEYCWGAVWGRRARPAACSIWR